MVRKSKSVNGKFEITRTDRAGNEYTYTANVPTASTPIKSKEDLYRIRQALRGENPNIKKPHEKYLILFEIACTIGLRIGDTLQLTPQDIIEGGEVYESKTGKKHLVAPNERLKELVTEYIKKYDLKPTDKLIFANRKDGNRSIAIDKSQAYRKLKEVVETVCPDVRFSNHTCRKTWAYMFYLSTGKDIAKVQKAMGHTSSLITADYIGLSKAELKAELESFDPFQ